MTHDYLTDLNQEQRRAVKHGVKDGSALNARPLGAEHVRGALPLAGTIRASTPHLSQSLRGSLASLLKRDRIKDFFRFPVSGLFDGSKKLWFLRRRSVRCRLRRL